MATRKHLVSLLLAGLSALFLPGCGTDIGGFVGVRSLNLCNQNVPVCNTAAGCVIDDTQYLQGTLPATVKFIFRTPGPAEIEVQVLFTQELSAGSSTEIQWNEVGCSSEQTFSNNGQNVFQLAGDSQEITATKTVESAGDHLITFISDATAEYEMRAQIVQ